MTSFLPDEIDFRYIPDGWMLMTLTGPRHSDGKFYCCFRTTDPDGVGVASAESSWSFGEAFDKAKALIPSDSTKP